MKTRWITLPLLCAIFVGCAGAPTSTLDPPTLPEGAVVGIVRVDAPWWAPEGLIHRKFEGAVPEYESIPGLSVKFFIVTEDRSFGGVYVWRDEESARAFYTEQWADGIEDRRGSRPRLELYEVRDVRTGEPIAASALTERAYAVEVGVSWAADEGAERGAFLSATLVPLGGGEPSSLTIHTSPGSASATSSVVILPEGGVQNRQ